MSFITYQGCRVAPGTLAAFKALAADFKKATGFELQLTPPVGGVRSYVQQNALYHAYLAGGTLAASPDDPSVAMHLEQNARALDVHDTGPVPGVTTAGSPRNNVLAQLAPKHGFALTGLTFRPQEGWHIEYQGDQWTAPTTVEETMAKLDSQDLKNIDSLVAKRVNDAVAAIIKGVWSNKIDNIGSSAGAAIHDILINGGHKVKNAVTDIASDLDGSK